MRINKRTLELNAWFLEKEEKGQASTFHLHPYILSNLLKDDDHRGLCSETNRTKSLAYLPHYSKGTF